MGHSSENPTGRTALVVGGGITGSAAAIELSRAGFRVDLVERQSTWSVLGSGISLIVPALRALERLRLLDRCLEVGLGVVDIVICDVNSEVINTAVLPQPLGPDRPGMLGMMRPELHRIMAEAAVAEGVQVRLGTVVTSFEDVGSHVTVSTSDGEVRSYDLVVGADGLRSQIRSDLFGDLDPVFRGQAVYRAVVRKDKSIRSAYQFHGLQAVHSGFTPTAVDKAYMFCLIAVEDSARPDDERLPDLMREHLAGFRGLAGDMRDTIVDPQKVDYRPMETFLLPAPWHKGRVVIIGDAAHTATPQLAAGAAMCLEDAIALGESLTGDVVEGLAEFSRRRFDRCKFVVETSIALSDEQMRPGTDGTEHARMFGEAVKVLAENF